MKFLQAIQQCQFERLERRREPRTFTNREVVLQVVTDEYRTGVATVLDWSVNGMRVRHSLSLKSGQQVKVIAPDWVLTMRVVWVGYINGVFEAGLALERGRESSWEPDHVSTN